MVDNNIHKEFMRQALNLAIKSAEKGTGPFGCVVVREGIVLGEGWNQVTELNDPSAHAEMQAVRKACKKLQDFKLTGCDVYTSCFPCPQCLGLLYWARPGKVYFLNTAKQAADIGFDDLSIYCEFTKADADKSLLLEHIDLPNELEAFTIWSKNPNKILY